MKHALALILACCALVAQDKPAAEAPKPAAEAPKPVAVEKPAEAKPKIPPINVRDELIELIHQLKKAANEPRESVWKFSSTNEVIASLAIAEYEAKAKAKTEAQRLLLQALVELAKEAERKKPTEVYHSSTPPESSRAF